MIPDALLAALKDRRLILFVGAGVSMNVGLPSFYQLVSHIGEELGFHPDIFHTFGDYQTLSEYYELERGGIGELRSWMDRTWHPPTIEIASSNIHRRIVELNFPIIYTTNYDRWIEEAHKAHGKAYVKIASVGDLAKPHTSETMIIKFHGDFDNDDSLVLTESSYFDRMGFETPLDIKLRSDTLGQPLLFIGYSLGDFNIRYLLYKLQQLWDKSPHRNRRPKSYILLTQANPVAEKVFEARGVVPVVWKSDDPGEALSAFLEALVAANSA